MAEVYIASNGGPAGIYTFLHARRRSIRRCSGPACYACVNDSGELGAAERGEICLSPALRALGGEDLECESRERDDTCRIPWCSIEFTWSSAQRDEFGTSRQK